MDSIETFDAQGSRPTRRTTRRRIVNRTLASCALAVLGIMTFGTGVASAHVCDLLVPAVNDTTVKSEGTYRVSGLLFSDTTPIAFPDGGLDWPTAIVEYTHWDRADIVITTTTDGPDGASVYHVQAPGDLFVHAPKGSEDAVLCGVPQVDYVTPAETTSPPTTEVPADALTTAATPAAEAPAESSGAVLSAFEVAEQGTPAAGELPATGATVLDLLFAGLALIGFGSVALMITARQRTASA